MRKIIKVLFVGSNPSGKSKTYYAFAHGTKSKKVLDKWTTEILGGDDKLEWWFANTNVTKVKTPNNKPLTIKQIKEAAINELKPQIVNDYAGYKIVALGRAAETALTLLGLEHFAMPHPSGRNRLLNDKEYLEEKLKSLREYLRPKSKTKKS